MKDTGSHAMKIRAYGCITAAILEQEYLSFGVHVKVAKAREYTVNGLIQNHHKH